MLLITLYVTAMSEHTRLGLDWKGTDTALSVQVKTENIMKRPIFIIKKIQFYCKYQKKNKFPYVETLIIIEMCAHLERKHTMTASLRDQHNTNDPWAACLRRLTSSLVFCRPCKQIRAATQGAWEERETHRFRLLHILFFSLIIITTEHTPFCLELIWVIFLIN